MLAPSWSDSIGVCTQVSDPACCLRSTSAIFCVLLVDNPAVCLSNPVAEPSIQAQLVATLIRTLVPLAKDSTAVQTVLSSILSPRTSSPNGHTAQNEELPGVNAYDAGNDENASSHACALFATLPPYELCTPADVPGLRELHQARSLHESNALELPIEEQLLKCEESAPSYLLGGFPVMNVRGEVESGAQPDARSVEYAGCISELNVQAAVTKVISILSAPDAYKCESIMSWFEDGKEEEEEEDLLRADVHPSKLDSKQDNVVSQRSALVEALDFIDDLESYHSGGPVWSVWNDPPFDPLRSSQRRSPLERTRRWLMRLASTPNLSIRLTELIAQALSLCVPLEDRHLHLQCATEPEYCGMANLTQSRAEHSSSNHLTEDLALHRYRATGQVRILLQIHSILISPDAPADICRLAAITLCNCFRDAKARRAAMSAFNGLRQLPGSYNACAHDHILPFTDETAIREAASFAFRNANASEHDCTAFDPGAISLVDPLAWAYTPRGPSGQYDHPSWICKVVPPMLRASPDPLLALCASLAQDVPRFGSSIFQDAVIGTVQQASGASMMADAFNAAFCSPMARATTSSNGHICPLQKAAALIRVLVVICRSEVTPDIDDGTSQIVPAVRSFLDQLDFNQIGEVCTHSGAQLNDMVLT